MKSTNYVMIQGWMCNELNLKGNDLLVYALIYGFSQDGESRFSGSRNYIATTFNISKPTVDKALQSLLDKGYICKHISEYINEPNTYWADLEVVKKLYMGSKETLSSSKETLPTDSKETLLNNNSNNKYIDNNKNNNKLQDFSFGKTKKKEKKDSLYTRCVSLIDSYDFSNWGNIRSLLVEYLKFRISVKDKPLYTNMWKGMLSKLSQLGQDDIRLYESVVRQSIERGYLSFYPVNTFSNVQSKPWEEGVTSSFYTDEELMELDELNREREEKGLQTRF